MNTFRRAISEERKKRTNIDFLFNYDVEISQMKRIIEHNFPKLSKKDQEENAIDALFLAVNLPSQLLTPLLEYLRPMEIEYKPKKRHSRKY